MNCFKLIASLLASASLLAAAVDIHLRLPPALRPAVSLMRQGDNPAALDQFFQTHWPTTTDVLWCFRYAIFFDRSETFNYLLDREPFAQEDRDKSLTYLLKLAIESDSIDMAGAVMDRRFQILRESVNLWMPHDMTIPWNLDVLKGFITAHHDQAAQLMPKNSAFKLVNNLEDFNALLELVKHCERESDQILFEPTKALSHLLRSFGIGDEQMAQAAVRLLQEGADNNSQMVRDAMAAAPASHQGTVKLVREWVHEDIKDCACD
jgi:hypothetical protein